MDANYIKVNVNMNYEIERGLYHVFVFNDNNKIVGEACSFKESRDKWNIYLYNSLNESILIKTVGSRSESIDELKILFEHAKLIS